MRNKINRRKLENGTFSAIVIIAVVIMVVLVNYIVKKEFSAKMTHDFTKDKLYSISEQSENIVNNLTDDVTVYLMAKTGSEDEGIKKLMSSYERCSAHLKFKTVDPIKDPTFVNEYAAGSASMNSLIFVGEKRNKVVDYNDIYKKDNSEYYMTGETTTVFDGEGEITSAIDFVTTDDLPVLYVISGNDEEEVPDSLIEMIERQNIEVKTLDMVTQKKIPDDASAIMINSPASDLSKEQTAVILSYMKNDGKALIISDYTDEKLPNFNSILSYYGISHKDGIVIEGDSSCYVVGYPYFVLPTLVDNEITQPIIDAKMRILIPAAQAIVFDDELRGGLEATTLLTTSGNAYIKENASPDSDFSQDEKDEKGMFTLGTLVTENDTKLITFSSSSIVNKTYSEYVSGANWDLVTNSICMMCDHKSGIDIHVKNLDNSQNMTVDSAAVKMWAIVLIGVIPVLVIILGVIVCIERRKVKASE